MKRLFFALPAVILFSCQYNTHVRYNETQCTNPWESSHNPTIYINNIKHYLWLNGIETGDVTVEEAPSGTYNCAACGCPSGRVIHVQIQDNDKSKAISLGFYE